MAQDDKNPVFTERVREQLLNQRILVLDGVLDDDNGTLLATQLLTLAAGDPAADAALWINSPGGSVPSMLAIRDVMRLVPCDVSTLALGLACSAGQFLLSAGAKGKRFALPHARILMHRGSAGSSYELCVVSTASAWPARAPSSSLVSRLCTSASFSVSITCSRSEWLAMSRPSPDAAGSGGPVITGTSP